MEGTYPLIIDGALVGKLTVSLRGPQTVFDVSCRMLTGIVRVSVYGGGREGYLGVLTPEGDGLGLHKAMSRTAMRDFPQVIDSVEEAGLLARHQADLAQPAAEAVTTAETVSEAQPEPAAEAASEVSPEPEAVPVSLEASAREQAPDPAPAGQDCYWYASPDGALVCFDGTQNLLALPEGDARIPAGAAGERRSVDGRDYLVFPTKNGKVQW